MHLVRGALSNTSKNKWKDFMDCLWTAAGLGGQTMSFSAANGIELIPTK